MREIKFRAWVSWMGGKMLGWDELLGYDANIIFSVRDDIEPDEIILMQYTGLKDKNGKDIYEGDIVESEDFRPSTVSFKDGSFWFWDLPILESTDYQWEVIGNIYENQELLD